MCTYMHDSIHTCVHTYMHTNMRTYIQASMYKDPKVEQQEVIQCYLDEIHGLKEEVMCAPARACVYVCMYVCMYV